VATSDVATTSMPKRPEFINDEIYHISSRSVGDTVIFEEESDFYRGIFSIYEFNNSDYVSIWKRRREIMFQKRQRRTLPEGLPEEVAVNDTRNKLVEILAFSFMPNHLHLILKQLKNNGIVEFMKKVNGGYAKYFNEKYDRKGHLFNKFYPVHISNEDQLKNAFTYVHANLISLIEPGWKENGIKDVAKVREFLENNKRHSYPDYIGKKNFPSVTERDFLLKIMEGAEGCRLNVNNWLLHKKEIKDLRDIFI